jgi:hypothetical protein
MNYTTDEYPFLVNEVMKYISEMKVEDPSLSLIDIIFNYCFKFNLDVELVGDAINSDVYFKSFIEKDCQHHNVIRNPKPSTEIGAW